jgi:hypothetical protein
VAHVVRELRAAVHGRVLLASLSSSAGHDGVTVARRRRLRQASWTADRHVCDLSLMPAAPFSDWTAFLLFNAQWTSALNPAPHLLLSTELAADQAEPTNPPSTAGFTVPSFKPTFAANGAVPIAFGFHTNPHPFPDGVVTAQRRRLATWTGQIGDPMGRGGRRLGLEIEFVVFSRDQNGVGPDLTLAQFDLQYRGFGMRPIAPPNATPTQDTPIASASALGSPTAFPDTIFPSIPPSTVNKAVTFAPDGVARLRFLAELPETVAIGDYWELAFFMLDVNVNRVQPVQIFAGKYRYVTPPFEIAPNTAKQLLGDGETELSPQSRTDEIVYVP